MYPILTKVRLITLTITSLCLFIFSIVVAFVILPLIIDSQIDKNVKLVRGTDQWHRFKQLPFNITFNVTLFEVTNANEVINTGEDPVLKERGPFVFDEVINKVNIKYNDTSNTITYHRKMAFHFNQSRSGPDMDYDADITVINPVYLAIMQMTKDVAVPLIDEKTKAKTIMKCLNKMFKEKLLLTISVRKLVFDGFNICDFSSKSCQFIFIPVCSYFLDKTKLIEEVKNDNEHYLKFSFMNYKQREYDGLYEIDTGTSDINKVGSIVKWNNKIYTDYWVQGLTRNSCDSVRGTDGTIFPPHVNAETKLSVYSTDICRAVEAFYDGEASYSDKEGYRYKTSPWLFYSSTRDPSDDCFCTKKTLDVDGKESCFMDGVMDFYGCIGVPVLFSYPHFLHAEKKYLKRLKGDISPDEEKHSLYMLVEKYTGVPLEAHKRVQINMISRPVKYFEDVSSNLPRTILPIVWIDEGIELPELGIDLLDSLLYDTLTLVNILEWVFIGVTLGLTILSSLMLFSRYSTCLKK